MKNRSLAIGLASCVALSLATATVPPVSVMAAEQTMADQYQPVFPTPSKPFGRESDKRLETLEITGVPSGTTARILNVNWGNSAHKENEVVVDTLSKTRFYIIISDESHYPATGASNTTKFLLEYPDGSSKAIEHTFTVYPAQRFSFDPELEQGTIEAGSAQEITIGSLPRSAKIEILDAPADWNVSVDRGILKVLAPKAGKGTIYGRAMYSDGSTDALAFDLTATSPQSKTTAPKSTVPEATSSKTPDTPSKPSEPTVTVAPETVTLTSTVKAPQLTVTLPPSTVTETITESLPPLTVTEKLTEATTVTETAAPATVASTTNEKANSVTTTVTENAVPVTTTVTESAAPVTTTVTQAQTVVKTLDSVTATVTENAAPVTTTVTEKAEAATVTKTIKEEQTGSSTGSIVALVIGLLGLIGGLGAAVVGNPQLRNVLPF